MLTPKKPDVKDELRKQKKQSSSNPSAYKTLYDAIWEAAEESEDEEEKEEESKEEPKAEDKKEEAKEAEDKKESKDKEEKEEESKQKPLLWKGFLDKVLAFLQHILETKALQGQHASAEDLGKMMACKLIPQMLWKAAFLAEYKGLDIPALKRMMEDWGSYFRITVCKYKEDELSKKQIAERQRLAKEVLQSFGFIHKWSPDKILQSACFHKNSDVVEQMGEELMDALQLTAAGSQWLSSKTLEKKVFSNFYFGREMRGWKIEKLLRRQIQDAGFKM